MLKNNPLLFQILTAFSITLGLLVIIGIGAFWLTIKNVTCVIKTDQACPIDVMTKLQTLQGKRLLFTTEIQSVVESEFIAQRYEVLEVSKSFFGDITISLNTLEAAYTLVIGDTFYSVSSQGSMVVSVNNEKKDSSNGCTVVLAKVESSAPDHFKQSTMLNQLVVDQQLHDKIILLMQALRTRKLQCDEIKPIDQNAWLLVLPTNKMAVINPTEIDSNLDRLVLVLTGSLSKEIDQTDNYLDVRFAMPVLRKTL